MIKFNVISSNTEWKRYLSNPTKYFEKIFNDLNKKNKLHKNKVLYCTILLSGSNEVKKLNRKFRNKNKTTDVLSFPFYGKKDLQHILKKEKEIYLGDIIINLNKVKNKKKKIFISELNKLCIHGLIHLYGHDHKKDKDFFKMQKIEKRFLSYIK